MESRKAAGDICKETFVAEVSVNSVDNYKFCTALISTDNAVFHQ